MERPRQTEWRTLIYLLCHRLILNGKKRDIYIGWIFSLNGMKILYRFYIVNLDEEIDAIKLALPICMIFIYFFLSIFSNILRCLRITPMRETTTASVFWSWGAHSSTIGKTLMTPRSEETKIGRKLIKGGWTTDTEIPASRPSGSVINNNEPIQEWSID